MATFSPAQIRAQNRIAHASKAQRAKWRAKAKRTRLLRCQEDRRECALALRAAAPLITGSVIENPPFKSCHHEEQRAYEQGYRHGRESCETASMNPKRLAWGPDHRSYCMDLEPHGPRSWHISECMDPKSKSERIRLEQFEPREGYGYAYPRSNPELLTVVNSNPYGRSKSMYEENPRKKRRKHKRIKHRGKHYSCRRVKRAKGRKYIRHGGHKTFWSTLSKRFGPMKAKSIWRSRKKHYLKAA